jgi:hypothetical protein
MGQLRYQKMISGTGADDVEQVAHGFVNVCEIGIISSPHGERRMIRAAKRNAAGYGLRRF